MQHATVEEKSSQQSMVVVAAEGQVYSAAELVG